ncbi:MAG: hypothetical protein WCK35_27940, partial [Chloroflexota bacterium]
WMEKGFYGQARDELSLSRQRTAGLLPELQLLEAEANLGTGAEDQARGKWETIARDDLRNLRITDSEVLLQEILALINKPFSSFSEVAGLPAVIATHTFVLNEEIRKKATELVRVLSRLKSYEDELKEIERKTGADVEFVRALSEAREFLKGVDPTFELSLPLKARLDETRVKIEKSSQLLEEINQRPGFVRLQEIALELSIDDSLAASQMREQVALRWLDQFRALLNLQDARERVTDGLKLFRDIEAARTIVKYKDQIDLLLMIEKDLLREDGRSYPIWMSDENDLRLSRYDEALNALNNESWQLLRQAAAQNRVNLNQSYESYLMEYVDRLRGQVTESDDNLGRVLADLQQHKRVDALLSESARKIIAQFEQSLNQVIRVKRAYLLAETAFASEGLSFTDTYNKIRDDISLEGMSGRHVLQFESLLGEWKQASLMELARNKPADSNDRFAYVSLITEILDLQSAQLPGIGSQPAVSSRLEMLRAELRKKMRAETDALRKELGLEAGNLQNQAQNKPEAFLRFYWQVRWYRSQTEDSVEKQLLSSELQIAILGCYRKMFEKLAELWAGLDNEQGAAAVINMSAGFNQLLHGLRELPEALQFRFTRQDDYALPEPVPEANAFDVYAAQIKELETFGKSNVSNLPQLKSDLGRIEKVLNTLTSSLKSKEDSPVGRLLGLLQAALLPLASLLSTVSASLESQGSLSSLIELDDQGRVFRQQSENPAMLWLLGNYQKFLQKNYDMLQATCKDTLQIQAQTYLQGDPVTAPEKLWSKMMLPCGTDPAHTEIRGMVREAIVKAGEKESGVVAGKKGTKVTDKGRAKRIWHAINLASSKGQSDEWKKLGEVAAEQEKTLSGLDPRWRMAILAAGLLSLFIVAGVVYFAGATVDNATAQATSDAVGVVQTQSKMAQEFIAGTATNVAATQIEAVLAVTKVVYDAQTQAAGTSTALSGATGTQAAFGLML